MFLIFRSAHALACSVTLTHICAGFCIAVVLVPREVKDSSLDWPKRLCLSRTALWLEPRSHIDTLHSEPWRRAQVQAEPMNGQAEQPEQLWSLLWTTLKLPERAPVVLRFLPLGTAPHRPFP
jgi:hypothetical protein